MVLCPQTVQFCLNDLILFGRSQCIGMFGKSRCIAQSESKYNFQISKLHSVLTENMSSTSEEMSYFCYYISF